jgi:hypothetical protein
MTALTLQEGYENNNFGLWTTVYQDGGTCSVESANANKGVYNGKYSATLSPYYAWTYLNFTAGTAYYGRAYVKVSALPTAGNYITLLGFATLDDASNFTRAIIRESSGSTYWGIKGLESSADVEHLSSTTVAASTYYCVEIYCKTSATEGEVYLWVNNVELIHLTGLNNSGNIESFFVGVSSHTESIIVYADDVMISANRIGSGGQPPFEITYEANNVLEWQENLSGNSGSDPIASSSYAAKGTYSGRYQIADVNWSYSESRLGLATASPMLYYSGHCRVSSLPPAGETLFVGMGMRGNILTDDVISDLIIGNNGGTIRWGLNYCTGSGSAYTLSTLTAIVNTWYFIEMMSSISNSAGVYKLWANTVGGNISEASPLISMSGLDNNYYGSIQHIVAMAYAPAGLVCDAYMDAYMVSTLFPSSFAINTITSSTNSLIRTGAYPTTINVLWSDPYDSTITAYECNVYCRDANTISTLGPYECTISKLSAGSFQGSVAIDPDASFPLSYYSVKAVVERTSILYIVVRY